MTRFDAFSPQERETIKKEIKQEIRSEDKRKRLIGCSVLFIVIVLAIGMPTLYVAAQFAKSGFFDVPVLSRSLYKPSEPVRAVIPLVGSKPEDIYRVLGTKVKYEPQTSQATFSVSESELTTLVQHSVASAPPNVLPFPIRTIQVAIDPDAVEIFAISPQKNRDATVRVRFKPTVKNGDLRADVAEIKIGSLVVPQKIGQLLFSAFSTLVTDSVTTAVANVGRLVDIGLDQGTARFVIVPTAPR